MVVLLKTVLSGAGFDLATTAILLHKPRERDLARHLPWMAAEDPEGFAAFSATHSRTAEAMLKKRPSVVSFVRTPDGGMLLAGCYLVLGFEDRQNRRIWSDPVQRRLHDDWGYDCGRSSLQPGDKQCVFDLRRINNLQDYEGRLLVRPKLTQGYARRAENLDCEVAAIYEENQLVAAPPNWREMFLTGRQVRRIGASWAARLREWRGIYLIVDEVDGARYVGSAYGSENILGRWRDHVSGETGVTKHLAKRDPARFRFSILERVSPDLPPDEVIALERTWMDRIHTRRFGLNE